MSYSSPYSAFIFEGYSFDKQSGMATFRYSFDEERLFTETITFGAIAAAYDEAVLDRALQLSYILSGISYYKTFPTKRFECKAFKFSELQAQFFSSVYRDGLSQFVYENSLDPGDIGHFEGSGAHTPLGYEGKGLAVLQSGGKDSLLLATLLGELGNGFSAVYVRSGTSYPAVIDMLGQPVRVIQRTIDTESLRRAHAEGGLNGHVPITYIVLGYALVDAILHDDNTVLAAIGREGEEPYAYIGDYAVRHQWSKTWQAEQMFADYVSKEISAVLQVGSPLRGYSELKIAELFAEHAWERYGSQFSSCNVANYTQGHDNTTLQWCGECPKCANSFLLFAPFVPPHTLEQLFGRNLFKRLELEETFKGLLGVGDAEKPFECVGETDELRRAYHMALANDYKPLPFEVPQTSYDYNLVGTMQSWAKEMLQ